MSNSSILFLLTVHPLNMRHTCTGVLPDTGGDFNLSQTAMRLRGGDFISFVLVSSVCLPPDIILFFSATAGDLWCVWKLLLHTLLCLFSLKKIIPVVYRASSFYLTNSCSGGSLQV